jgi:hypothetical protein
LLAKNKEPPIIRDATFGRARVIKQGRRHIIVLVTKIRAPIYIEREILKKALRSLYDVTLELNLHAYPFPKRRFSALGLYKENFTGII